MSKLTAEQKAENVIKWINALWSGEYKQTTLRLGDGRGYCCLGLGCKLTGVDFSPMDSLAYGITKTTGLLTENGELKNGSDRVERYTSLAALNDDEGYKFDQIADVIWKYKDDLFEPKVAKALSEGWEV